MVEWHDLKKILAGGAQIVFSEDMNKSQSKRFTSVDTHQEFIDYMLSLPKEHRHFYEYIFKDKPIKLYYDVDICPGVDNVIKNTIIHQIIELTKTSVKEFFDVDLVREDFAILDSSGKVYQGNCEIDKTSMHIVLVHKVHFGNIDLVKDYVQKVFFESSDKEHAKVIGIDIRAYGARSLRMPGSTKMADIPRYLDILSGHSILDCLLTHIPESNTYCVNTKIKRKQKNAMDKKFYQMVNSDQQVSVHELFSKCVEALPDLLAKSYDTWINTGIKMYIAGASEVHWHMFSKKDKEKYDEPTAHTKWLSFYQYKTDPSRTCTATTFFNLVSRYDSHVVQELRSRSLSYIGKYSNEIALTLSRLYGENHIYSNGLWYFYNGVRWIEDEDKMAISRVIITDFHNRLDQEIRSINEFLSGCMTRDNNRYEQEEARLQILYAVKDKTQGGRIYTDWHVLNVAFEQTHFSSMLDTKKNLIGFENGVYDLDLEMFCHSSHEQFVTMSLKYDYMDIEAIDEEDFIFLDNFINQVFPDPELRQYIMMFIGSCLSGEIKEEHIHFFTGLSNKQTGSNGKSTFISLLLYTFGDYATCGHSSIITSKRESAQSANSAMMALKGKRLVTFQEIDNENSINMPVIKSLTGNDRITARQLHRNQETFEPHWKMIVCANKLPPVTCDDGGTRRRLRNVPFESKFVDDVNDPKWKGMENVYPVNLELKQKLDKLKYAMIHRLIQGYIDYKHNRGLPKCRKIEIHTEKYFRDNDQVLASIDTHLILTDDDKSFIRIEQIYDIIPMNLHNKFNKNELQDKIIDLMHDTYHASYTCTITNTTYQHVFLGWKFKTSVF